MDKRPTRNQQLVIDALTGRSATLPDLAKAVHLSKRDTTAAMWGLVKQGIINVNGGPNTPTITYTVSRNASTIASQGQENPMPVATKYARKSRTTKTVRSTKTEKATKHTVAKDPTLYTGAPVPATKVYRRKLEGFDSKHGNQCPAYVWLLLNLGQGTVTFCNTYNTDMIPKPSWKPETYTYAYKPKVHDPKMEAMEEIDVTEWPQWIQNSAAAKRRTGRKASSK